MSIFLEQINDHKGYSIFHHKLLSWKIWMLTFKSPGKNAYEKVWEPCIRRFWWKASSLSFWPRQELSLNSVGYPQGNTSVWTDCNFILGNSLPSINDLLRGWGRCLRAWNYWNSRCTCTCQLVYYRYRIQCNRCSELKRPMAYIRQLFIKYGISVNGATKKKNNKETKEQSFWYNNNRQLKFFFWYHAVLICYLGPEKN